MFSFVCVPSFLDTHLFRINVCPECLAVTWGWEDQEADVCSLLTVTLWKPWMLSRIWLWPHELQPTRLLCPWDFPGKNSGMDCHFLLQGIFPTQGYNPCLLWFLNCRQILYHWATSYVIIGKVSLSISLSTKWDHGYLYFSHMFFLAESTNW